MGSNTHLEASFSHAFAKLGLRWRKLACHVLIYFSIHFRFVSLRIYSLRHRTDWLKAMAFSQHDPYRSANDFYCEPTNYWRQTGMDAYWFGYASLPADCSWLYYPDVWRMYGEGFTCCYDLEHETSIDRAVVGRKVATAKRDALHQMMHIKDVAARISKELSKYEEIKSRINDAIYNVNNDESIAGASRAYAFIFKARRACGIDDARFRRFLDATVNTLRTYFVWRITEKVGLTCRASFMKEVERAHDVNEGGASVEDPNEVSRILNCFEQTVAGTLERYSAFMSRSKKNRPKARARRKFRPGKDLLRAYGDCVLTERGFISWFRAWQLVKMSEGLPHNGPYAGADLMSL